MIILTIFVVKVDKIDDLGSCDFFFLNNNLTILKW